MSVIVGRCEHDHIQKAVVERYASADELDGMAHSYTLERVQVVSVGGQCELCRGRYLANRKLLEITPDYSGAAYLETVTEEGCL